MTKGRPVTVWHPFRIEDLRSLAAQGFTYARAAVALRTTRGAISGAARKHQIRFGR